MRSDNECKVAIRKSDKADTSHRGNKGTRKERWKFQNDNAVRLPGVARPIAVDSGATYAIIC